MGYADKDLMGAIDVNTELESFSHYARVLVLDHLIRVWWPDDAEDHPFHVNSSETRAAVMAWLDAKDRNTGWADADKERPTTTESSTRTANWEQYFR